MSHYYQLGLAVQPRPAFEKYHVGAFGGATGIADTGLFANIPKEVDSIDVEMNSLNTQMFNELPATTDNPKFTFYTAVWGPFLADWKAAAHKYGDRSFVNFIRSQSAILQRGVFKDLQEYRARLGQMWKSAEDSGFGLQGPAPTAPRKDPGEDLSDFMKSLMKLLKTLLWVAIAGGAIWLGLMVFQGVRHG